jgi:hypothetical protein
LEFKPLLDFSRSELKEDINSKNWDEIKLPFSKFERSSSWISKKISGDKIKTIGIVAYGKNHNAVLDVSYVSFY